MVLVQGEFKKIDITFAEEAEAFALLQSRNPSFSGRTRGVKERFAFLRDQRDVGITHQQNFPLPPPKVIVKVVEKPTTFNFKKSTDFVDNRIKLLEKEIVRATNEITAANRRELFSEARDIDAGRVKDNVERAALLEIQNALNSGTFISLSEIKSSSKKAAERAAKIQKQQIDAARLKEFEAKKRAGLVKKTQTPTIVTGELSPKVFAGLTKTQKEKITSKLTTKEKQDLGLVPKPKPAPKPKGGEPGFIGPVKSTIVKLPETPPEGFFESALFNIQQQRGREDKGGVGSLISGAAFGATEVGLETGIFAKEIVTHPIETSKSIIGGLFGIIKDPVGTGKQIVTSAKKDPARFAGKVGAELVTFKFAGTKIAKGVKSTSELIAPTKFVSKTVGVQENILSTGKSILVKTETQSKVVKKTLFKKEPFFVDTKSITGVTQVGEEGVIFAGKSTGQIFEVPTKKKGLLGTQDKPIDFTGAFGGVGKKVDVTAKVEVVPGIQKTKTVKELGTISISGVKTGKEVDFSLIAGITKRKGDKIISVASDQPIKFPLSVKEADLLKTIKKGKGKGLSSSEIKTVDKIVKKFELEGNTKAKNQLLANLKLDDARAVSKLQVDMTAKAAVKSATTKPPSLITSLITGTTFVAAKAVAPITPAKAPPIQKSASSLIAGGLGAAPVVKQTPSKTPKGIPPVQDSAISLITGSAITPTPKTTPTKQITPPTFTPSPIFQPPVQEAPTIAPPSFFQPSPQLQIPTLKQRVEETPAQLIAPISLIGQPTKQITPQITTPITGQPTKEIVTPITGIGLITGQPTRQATVPRQVAGTGFVPGLGFGTIPIVPFKTPTGGFVPIIPQGEESNKKVFGYNTYVKSKGKFKKANIKPRSKKTALSIGANITDHSLSRTFEVRKTKNKIKPKKKQPKYFADNQFKFRTFKQKKGVRTPLTNTYIEKSAWALDKSQEKNITSLALITRRRNALAGDTQPKRKRRKQSSIGNLFGI